MKFKAYIIIGLGYLEKLLLLALAATFIHFMYKFSKPHAIILLYLNLTYLLAGYSIRTMGKDYLDELYASVLQEEITDGQETRKTDQGRSEQDSTRNDDAHK